MHSFDYFTLSFLIGGVVGGAVGAYALSRRTAVRPAWSALAFCIAFVNFSMLALYGAKDEGTARIALYLAHAGLIALPVAFMYFVWVLTRKLNTRRPYLQTLIAVACVFEIFNVTPYFTEGLSPRSFAAWYPDAGPLYIHFVVYFCGVMSLALYLLWRAMRRSDVHGEVRFRFMLWVSAVGSVGFLSYFPYAFHIDVPPLFAIFTALIPIITVYVVIRERYFDAPSVGSELFIIALWMVFFMRVLLSRSQTEYIIDLGVLAASIGFGSMLIRNVRKEFENRERGERLARYLSNANARLRDLDKQKTEFVSLASHQLRGPIAAIVGYVSLIQEKSYGPVPEHLTEPLSRIFESGKRISLMVDDFLNVTRIEQGRMSYTFVTADIIPLITRAVEEFRVLAEKKGLALAFLAPDEHPMLVRVDEGKFAQVLQNLIDNAVKFTPQGSVTVSARMNERSTKVLISIADTGIGIAPEEVHNLSHKFNRASNANSVSVYGSGLGLYISKEILKAHDGWIYISSAGVGKGSTFTIELPIERGERMR